MSSQALAIYSYIASSVLLIVGLLVACIKNPNGAINTFMIKIIDIIIVVFPATPEEYKLKSLLNTMASSYPLFGWGLVSEIFTGIFGILAIFLVVKIFKFLPFF